MTTKPELIVAISSRALFDLTESNMLYEQEGIESYARYQIERENEILKPGTAFPLVKKLLNLNKEEKLVEVILLSRNSADTGLRIFNSIAHYQLPISRAVFTSGHSPYVYVQSFDSHLFLSIHELDVKRALDAGCAAATIIPKDQTTAITDTDEIHIAFDGDCVLFSSESEQIYQRNGLAAFEANEKAAANIPLPGGPFKGFLMALHRLQNHFPKDHCPIQTALVTARQAPAHERVIKTLRAWNIRIDQALFLGGLDKVNFLSAFKADIFFDDQTTHCQASAPHVATGQVPV